MQQLSGGDSFFLYTDKPGKHQHIGMISIYDQSTAEGGVVRFKTILEHIRTRLTSAKLFRQRLLKVPLDLDYPYWIEDPDFDLEYHVRHIALPKPGDWRQFCILVSRLNSRPLDMTRPVWEMYVIEGLDNAEMYPPGSFAIMTKIHHAAVDGVASNEFQRLLHDLEPRVEQKEIADTWQPEQAPGLLELAYRGSINNSRRAVKTASTLFGKFTGLGDTVLKTLSEVGEEKEPPEEKAPNTRFNQVLSPHRVWDAAIFPLDDIKKIKDSVAGATINDVVLTICGGAMINFLRKKDELPESNLWALVPISVRSESEKGTAGNHVFLARTNLMTLEDDPLERLHKVALEMVKVKEINATGAREMTNMQNHLPSATLSLATRAVGASFGPGKGYRASHNMVVTNVPGPQQALYLCGAKLLTVSGMAPIVDQLTMSQVITSYNGELVIAPHSDRKIMPDPELYTRCVVESFEELKRAAGGSLKPAVRKKKLRKKVAKRRVKRKIN